RAEMLAPCGEAVVLRPSLVLDSGWVGCPDFDGNPNTFDPMAGPSCQDHRVDLSAPSANGTGHTPLPAGDVVGTPVVTTGTFASTCALPAAEIKWTKSDPIPDGAINETAESVQLRDTGQFFRIVDCKYIYNLDTSSLGPE